MATLPPDRPRVPKDPRGIELATALEAAFVTAKRKGLPDRDQCIILGRFVGYLAGTGSGDIGVVDNTMRLLISVALQTARDVFDQRADIMAQPAAGSA